MGSLAGLLMCLTGMFALQGCASLAVSESGSSDERRPEALLPMTIRTLNSEHRFTQISAATVARQLHALHGHDRRGFGAAGRVGPRLDCQERRPICQSTVLRCLGGFRQRSWYVPSRHHSRPAGAAHKEAHVDGAATVPFFVPAAFVQAPSEAFGGAHATTVYVLIDGPLAEAARTTRLTARRVLSRSIDAGLNHLLVTTLELTAATAQLQGATLHYSAVPAAYPYLDAFDFRAATRRPLFRYAYKCAQEGRLWAEIRRTDNDEGTAGGAQLQKVPCPSDDPFIGYFATR